MASTRDLNTTPSPTAQTSPPPPTSPPPAPGGNVPLPGPDPGGVRAALSTKAMIAGIATVAIIGGAALGGGEIIEDWLEPQSSFIADGPFAYRFTKGEILTYELGARVQGTGFDMGVGSEIGLLMNMSYSLETQSIDRDGYGTLELNFDEVNMTGNFMGDPVQLYQSGSDVQMDLNKFEQIDTDQGDSIEGVKQLEFFNTPITMVVGPDGHVEDVQGAPGFDLILSPSKAMTPSRFTSSHLEIGDSWVSEFNLPVPGLAVPAAATTQNTLVAYEMIGTRNCGVIEQIMISSQTDGQLNSPSSILGEEMGFTMPTFEVSGINRIWFDVDGGKLVRTEMNLVFNLEIGEQLDQIKSALGGLAEALDSLENSDRPGKQDEEEGPLLDMGVQIDATLTLVE